MTAARAPAALPPAGATVPATAGRLSEDERARVTGQAARSLAPETRRGYQSDRRRWEAWCEARRVPAWPADPEMVALYVTDHAALVKDDGRPAYAAATLDRWVASLSALSRAAGQDPRAGTRGSRRSWPGSAATARRRGSPSASGTR